MRAVNLIPSDGQRGSRGPGGLPSGPAVVVIGLLAVALVYVTIAVLTGNTISDRKAKLATVQAQVVAAQAQAAQLSSYGSFEQLAQTRAQTVREIAAARFDWHAALSDLSKVVPPNASLQSLVGSVAPGATISGGSGGTTGSGSGATSSLRGDLSVPAFELTGCTKSQDAVAQLISRLRLMNGVSRVTLGDSQKQAAAQAGADVSQAGTTAAAGCGPNAPTFDLVVFFQSVPGAGPTGVTSVSGTTPSTGGTP
jgi:Tfp pilus assembly protein PilN